MMNRQDGNAFTELAIVLPLLLLLIMGTVDLGRILNEYLTITRIAYEGTRYAASVAELEPGQFTVAASTPQSHQAVRERIGTLLERHDMSPTSSGITISTALYDKDAFAHPTIAGYDKVVHVRISVPFNSWFPLLDFMDEVSAEASGPYLFRS